jgi:hypothetical protein
VGKHPNEISLIGYYFCAHYGFNDLDILLEHFFQQLLQQLKTDV